MEISSDFHDPKAVFSMVYFLYHFSYSDDYPPCIVHVYNIAKAFDISALEALAIQRFEEAAIDQWDTYGFAEAIEELYDTEPDQELGLRNAILRISASHLVALLQQRGSFYRVLKSSGQFGADMVEYLVKSRQPAVRTEFKIECGNCHRAYSSSDVAWEKCQCASPLWSIT
ncbi:hypothetical protein B0A49_03344 [Cryomyces minteri]|uniref:BTB domain-containing protein n=1 Tax=Cryomyces minteri TaxID=331657 RepID=A0A4U0XWB6_9PEZI|nr:hypothetical protein B0A49_03344 [Cryomyces minteri]